MDEIGEGLKSNADRFILQGQGIFSGSFFVEKIRNSKVKVWEVPVEEISKAKTYSPQNYSSIPEIMSVHLILLETLKAVSKKHIMR